MENIKKEYYESLINDYVDGKARIRGDHPEEITKAIDSFFHAGKMLLECMTVCFILWLCDQIVDDLW